MNYIKFGESKKFLVFLHGWGADKNSFLWLKDYFSEFSLIFVDFPGFGESPEPNVPYSVSNYVEVLKNLLDDFEIDELVLVGHSFGGRVAIKFSFFYQHSYKKFKLCLIDSAGILPRRGVVYYYKIFKFKLLKRFCKNKSKLVKYGSSDFVKLSEVMKKTFISVVNEDLSRFAKFIVKPTLIVWGEKDTETKMFMARKLNRLISGSRLEIILGAGHFSFLDSPNEFIILLDTFIKS